VADSGVTVKGVTVKGVTLTRLKGVTLSPQGRNLDGGISHDDFDTKRKMLSC